MYRYADSTQLVAQVVSVALSGLKVTDNLIC